MDFRNTQVSLYVLAHGFCLHRSAGLGLLRRLFVVSANKNKEKTADFLRNKQQFHLPAPSSSERHRRACKILDQNICLRECRSLPHFPVGKNLETKQNTCTPRKHQRSWCKKSCHPIQKESLVTFVKVKHMPREKIQTC